MTQPPYVIRRKKRDKGLKCDTGTIYFPSFRTFGTFRVDREKQQRFFILKKVEISFPLK